MNNAKDKKLAIGMLIAFGVMAVLYFAQAVYSDSTGKIEYEYALKYTQEEKLNVKGFAVRDENRYKYGQNISVLIKNTNKVYVPVLSDSESVGKNDTIAIAFNNEDQAENYIKVKELQAKLNNLRELKSQGDLNYVNVVYLNSSIYNTVDDYVSCISGNTLGELDNSVGNFTAKMSTKQIATGGKFNINTQIKNLKKEIEALKETYDTSNKIKSSYAGYFVSEVDGYESVKSYKDVEKKKVKVNEGEKLINSKKKKIENVYGKIIAQHTWYFIFDTSITDASVIKTGNYVTVDFPEKEIEDITMKVYNVSELNGDTITVILQCTSMNEDLANLRIENAAITVKNYSGYRIDSSAIVENEEGLKGVNVIRGNYVQFTPVTISYYGDNYVIADKYIAYKEDEKGNKVIDEEKTSKYRSINLYDQIIVKGMHIDDGMVIS